MKIIWRDLLLFIQFSFKCTKILKYNLMLLFIEMDMYSHFYQINKNFWEETVFEHRKENQLTAVMNLFNHRQKNISLI